MNIKRKTKISRKRKRKHRHPDAEQMMSPGPGVQSADPSLVQRMMDAPESLTAEEVHALQATHGNQFVGQQVNRQRSNNGGSNGNGGFIGQLARPTPRPAIHRRMATPASRGAMGSSLVIQRALEDAKLDSIMNAHLRKGQRVFGPSPRGIDESYEVDDKKIVGHKIKNKTPIQVDKKKVGYTQGSSKTDWVYAEAGGYKGFIRNKKVKFGSSPPPEIDVSSLLAHKDKVKNTGTSPAYDPGNKGDQALEGLATTFGTAESPTDRLAGAIDLGYLKEAGKGDKEGLKVDKDNADKGLTDTKNQLDVSAGVAGTLGGLVGFVQAIRQFRDEGSGGWDKFLAVVMGFESTAKMVAGISKVVDAGAKAGGAKDGVGASDAVGKWTGSVGDAIGAVKEFFFTMKEGYDLYKKATGETGVSGGNIFKGVTNILKGLLNTAASVVKSVRGFIEIVKGGVSAALTTAIPAITIAVSGAVIALKAYNIIKAAISRGEMEEMEREFENTQGVANKPYVAMIEKKYGFFKNKTQEIREVDLAKLAQEEQTLESNTTRTPEQEKQLLAIREYRVVLEMKYINKKRIVRSSVQIGIEMAQIAGDIATLSGAGAVAGMPLKAFALGTEVGMSGLRKVKQFGRDKGWKGFNADKSSQKKHQRRVQDAKFMLDMAASLPPVTNPLTNDVKAQYKRVEVLLTAAGVDLNELYNLNKKPAPEGPKRQFALIVESMAKREE